MGEGREAGAAAPKPIGDWRVRWVVAGLVVLTVIAALAAVAIAVGGSLWLFHAGMAPGHRHDHWIADRRSCLLLSLVWLSVYALGWWWSLRWGTRRQRVAFVVLATFAAGCALAAAVSAPGSGWPDLGPPAV